MVGFPPMDGLLAIDIGNTRVGMAAWDTHGLHHARHVQLADPQSWRDALRITWSHLARHGKRTVVVGSVVPGATAAVCKLAGDVCDVEPLRIRDDLPLPMPLELDRDDEVGVDRVCSAAAAFDAIGGPCAIASFGSATTIDCVSSEGHFIGGTIMPGVEMSWRALHEFTAALPQVSGAVGRSPFGKSTHDCMVNGVLYGAAGALREIVERFATELGQWPHLVLTGGAAPLVAELVDFADSLVPDLCLRGVALAYRKASGAVTTAE
ncbi:MAG: Type III pantothenate kinase [Phycisphaerae bacterium]|nr:Type III pantothenate kinase [Phycisphaerae bacterium]